MSNPGFVANTIQVRLLWNDAVGRFMNVLHGQYTTAGPLNPAIAETIFSGLKTGGGFAPWLAHLPAEVSMTGVDVRDLRAPNNPLLTSTSAAVSGTAVGNALPPQSAAVVTLRTAFSGRAFRGRVYMGGLAQSTADVNGRIVAQVNTDAVGFILTVNGAMSGQGAPLGILQRWLPERLGHGGVTLPERQPQIVAVTIPSGVIARDTIFDTQRRRSGAHIGSR
jgi:hypothetical protein